ncbi:MAG: class I tRNA ligase family protein, partial [Candidatus Omnitrophica bacterium]|nr:class I tRNA ligase family protein [Candidatus Omnitrophota bacterium]
MDYKSTLNLPKTEFSMKADLPKREPAFLKAWYDTDIYKLLRQKLKGKPKYVLHDGPPYANGDIHIGHVLNKTLKDIIIKYKSMQGFDSPYIPGWDCHGLPVEHQLFKELGINKYQISQLEFRKKAYTYANKYVSLQKEQFKRLGVFGDWENPYLTLNPEYEESIVSSFAALVKGGYIYRGLKPVNWCYVCETALAEAEVEYEDHASPSIYVKFEILGLQNKIKDISNKKVYAIVWTTTPWTLIANVAIAVHPHFKYVLLEVGQELWLMQEDRVIPVMEQIGVEDYKKIDVILGRDLEGLSYGDIFKPERSASFKFVLAEYVSKEEGTGCVHTAPGHGQEDYVTGQKYNLETVMPVNSKGEFYLDKAIEFKGQHVFTANKNIVDKLQHQGNLLYSGQITHSYPHCWRCKTPIIFRATEQWFMDIDNKDLRKRLLGVIKKDIQWIPASGEERISGMVQLRPDWCLSRQRYWGVPIPALACN